MAHNLEVFIYVDGHVQAVCECGWKGCNHPTDLRASFEHQEHADKYLFGRKPKEDD